MTVRGSPRRIATGLLIVLGVYLIFGAAVEPFVIDFKDPSTYREDWGGPTLIGVLAYHMLPGLIGAVLLTRAAMRRRGARSSRSHQADA